MFIRDGIVTKSQIDEIQTPYTNDISTESKKQFLEARKSIEQNIDTYRENLTYMDLEYINIKRLLDIVWEFWRNNRQGGANSVNEQIIKNKKAYTELTISNIKDIDHVIDDFDKLNGDFNHVSFLTSISRLFTYISELQ